MSKFYTQDLDAPLLGTPVPDIQAQKYRRIAKYSLLISLISLVFSVASLHHRFVEVPVESPAPPATDNFAVQEMIDAVYPQCNPVHPKTYSFNVPPSEYHGLIVHHHLRDSVHVVDGDARVMVNPDIKDIVVTFDIRYDNEDDSRYVSISSEDDREGVRRITFDLEHHPHHHPTLCIGWDITIEVPSSDALKILQFGTVNQGIQVDDSFDFGESLSLATANGWIRFNAYGVRAPVLTLSTANGDITVDGVVSESASTFSTANGNIHADFSRLAGKHSSSTASGNIHVNASAVGTSDDASAATRLDLQSATGNLEAIVPDSFHSEFKIDTVLGKVAVTSREHPDKIHFKSKSRLGARGYYGPAEDDVQDGNHIHISSTVGDATITYL